MRKMMMTLFMAAALIISGVSVTTFASGQLTSTAWAEGGGA